MTCWFEEHGALQGGRKKKKTEAPLPAVSRIKADLSYGYIAMLGFVKDSSRLETNPLEKGHRAS